MEFFNRRVGERRATGRNTWADEVAGSADALITAAYRSLLGREPDAEGLAHWRSHLESGGSFDRLLRSFVRSPEYARRRLSRRTGAAVPDHAARGGRAAHELRFAIIGNCQAISMGHAVQHLTGAATPTRHWVMPDRLDSDSAARAALEALFTDHDFVLVQPLFWERIAQAFEHRSDRVLLFPSIGFRAFHPDLVYLHRAGTRTPIEGPGMHYHSYIAFLGWRAGLDGRQTLGLFRREVYQRLGYFDFWQSSAAALLEEGAAAGFDLGSSFERWRARGCFMLSINHPRQFVIDDLASMVLRRAGIALQEPAATSEITDPLEASVVWPVYPELAQQLGVEGGTRFKLENPGLDPQRPGERIDLAGFVERSFAVFATLEPHSVECERAPDGVLDWIRNEGTPSRTSRHMEVVVAATSSPLPTARRSRFAVLGNCQMGHMARCLQALVGGDMPQRDWVTPQMLDDWQQGRTDLSPLFDAHDRVFMQPWIWQPLAARYAHLSHKVVLYPSIGFMAYHPDLVPVMVKATGLAFEDGPTIRCNSSLAFLGWKAGLSVTQTLALFRREIYERLGFFDFWESSVAALMEEGRAAGLPLEDLFAQWRQRGCFMYCHVHPQIQVIADIARVLLTRLGVAMVPGDPMRYVDDYLAHGVVWPVYPEIGAALGSPGSTMFKLATFAYQPDGPVHLLALEEFIRGSFEAFNKHAPDELDCERLNLPAYRTLMDELRAHGTALVSVRTGAFLGRPIARAVTKADVPQAAKPSEHPYRGLPPERFWNGAVAGIAPDQFDPVVAPRVRIDRQQRVAAAGSCFAQYISRRLEDRGFNFLRTEVAPGGLPVSEAERRHFGLFPARFGNVYTARQLLQLWQRAFGEFTPVDSAWARGQVWVDPFRPQIEPDGFATPQVVDADRAQHLAAVRRMFETLDVFVFTLGLTEAWRAKADGAVLPLAPGVAGGSMDEALYEFVNFSATEVEADLDDFLRRLAAVNPSARVIFTVSPVPLAATYSPRHVAVATSYSKAVLRVAVEQIVQRHAHCDYFPSYEIITSAASRGAYYADDLRSVTPAGVDHVMRLFFKHHAASGETRSIDPQLLAEARANLRVLCDEELLGAAARSAA